ncbi:MAG: trypsin-like peptidase domain-containing protein [Eubacteriales bacterium]|nr:trypsin-like peptidase domain-containing protein [Eubacteriales bacterium]
MKRTAIAIILTLACVLLTPLSVFAIGFDTDEVYNSVVVIFSGNVVGSGFAIGEHCIITNAHVIDDETSVLVTTYSGEKARAKVESLDSKIDIAVLSVSSIDFAPLASANIDECKVGEDVYTIGAPNAMAYTLTRGILSAKDRKVGGRSYLQTDAAINTGNSGGPLLTTDGKVIGVNTLKITDNEGIGLAIPITDVYSFLASEEIPVDNDGTVDEVFANEPPTETTPQNTDTSQKQTETANLLLVVLLCCSVAINILFVVLWVYSKNKSRTRKADPTERTDFEIDILE